MFKNLFGRPKTAPVVTFTTPSVERAYRRHRPEDVDRFTALAEEAFSPMKGIIRCFGADWLGRQFATDSTRLEDGKPQVLMLEPGTGEGLQIPANIDTFHTQVLIEHADAAVAEPFFRAWIATGGRAPAYDQCIGYKVPLYLGGEDELSNLELSDFEVYWGLSAQLLAKARELPVGTPIRSIGIEY